MPCPSHSTPHASRMARQHLPQLRRTGDPMPPHRDTGNPPGSGIGGPGGWLGSGPVAVARRFLAGAADRNERLGRQLELGCGRLCPYRWWVRGWEICRSYQNCASRRDSHGQGSQAAQPGLTQLILVFPSGVLSSTGRCAAMRRGRASVVACMSSLLPQRVRPGVLVLVLPARLQTAASGAGGRVLRGQSATAGGSHSPDIDHVQPRITATRRPCH